MRKTSRLFLAALGALVAVSAAASVADARERARPLTVHKRSFLDAGKVVPVGSQMSYVTANTIFNETPDRAYMRARFGAETLPLRFSLPGFYR
jgi:hypothetical protein